MGFSGGNLIQIKFKYSNRYPNTNCILEGLYTELVDSGRDMAFDDRRGGDGHHIPSYSYPSNGVVVHGSDFW